jgi:hypothetical protein
MDIKKLINNLTEKELIIVAILFGWTIIHLILFMVSDGSTEYFWPFDRDPKIEYDYDFSEFAIYGLVPWIVFVVYKFLIKTKK